MPCELIFNQPGETSPRISYRLFMSVQDNLVYIWWGHLDENRHWKRKLNLPSFECSHNPCDFPQDVNAVEEE